MVSAVLASLLESHLGQYLELSDTSISVGSEVKLKNVRLKESAFADLGLPIKCVHGKVAKLEISIPWFSLWTKATKIKLDGLHLLVVPSTSVHYDEEKEAKLQFEAKQKRLQKAEEAKLLQQQTNAAGHEKKTTEDPVNDGFVQRLLANIIKNLEVNITNVHIRFEDKQTNSNGYPYATGVTLAELIMKTTSSDQEEKGTIKVFGKKVTLKSFAIYWKPRANLYSTDTKIQDDIIDVMFDQNIAKPDKNSLPKLRYLVGPISSHADLNWCPSPEKFDYAKPIVDLKICMDELSLQLTKYQYHDFMMLLQSIEFISRASQFRKYKARHGLENLANYKGQFGKLWKFAFDCIYEEEVMRQINNWSWNHMKEHLNRCKEYQALYKQKLSTKKPSEDLIKQLTKYEKTLDEFNIRIQRQLAERKVEEILIEKKNEATNSSWFSGWFSSSSSSNGAAVGAGMKDEPGNLVKKLKLSAKDKEELYQVIDYQENAHHGIYDKSFVAYKLAFRLGNLKIAISDEDKRDATIIQLMLSQVDSDICQRPSSDNIVMSMEMQSLTIHGFQQKSNQKVMPTIVSTRSVKSQKLISLAFENNPPAALSANGGVDYTKKSLYDQQLKVFSSPLEITYDKTTFNALSSLFKTPEEIDLANLQQQAVAKLNEYKESTALSLQYALDMHHLINVDIELQSSLIIIPNAGEFSDNCACSIINLGSISIKSKPISQETRDVKDFQFNFDMETFKSRILDKAYDNFNMSMSNIQMLVALPNENWRLELDKKSSPLFLLSPTTVEVTLSLCVVKNDPELPICKVKGKLPHISINISDYRLIKLAQILDSIAAPEANELYRADSNDSMHSAMSSLANTGTFILMNNRPSASKDILAQGHQGEDDIKTSKHLTKFFMDFEINNVNFKMSQLGKTSSTDEEIFNFVLVDLKAETTLRTFDFNGKFNLGDISCTHMLLKTPDGEPVKMLHTKNSDIKDRKLLSIEYMDVQKNSPELVSVHGNVLKRIDVNLAGVDLIVHQNAIMDLVNKVNKFTDEVISNSKNLIPVNPVVEKSATPEVPAEPQKKPEKKFERSLSRKLSFKTSTNIARWSARAKLKQRSISQGQLIDVQITARLESVSFHLMTSKLKIAAMYVQDVQASWVQTKEVKELTARLINFEICDSSNSPSLYKKIAESMDEKVFDAKISMFEHDPNDKLKNLDLVDVSCHIKMGQIRLVFLMKFINDILLFIEPFSGAKELVVEKAENALESATKTMKDAYENQTRVLLKVEMFAPIIIIPISSRNRVTFLANLGTLHLANRFTSEHGRVFDNMDFVLKNLQLNRVKIDEDIESNQVLATCPIIKPINLELKIKRNMQGAKLKEDPAELEITGSLYEIQAELSRGDYNALMAVLNENFSEKSEFTRETEQSKKAHREAGKLDKNALNLPLKSRHVSSGSRGSLGSTSSSIKNLKASLSVESRHPESKFVKFKFKFHRFQAEIFAGKTELSSEVSVRQAAHSLAKIDVQVLGVDGYVNINGAVAATAFLQNMTLEDSRLHEEDSTRIVKLMESKDVKKKMIDIQYNKDDKGNQNIEVFIHKFNVVGSVSYLLDIANFFVLDENMTQQWKKESLQDIPDIISQEDFDENAENKMNVFVKIEEPDIFLVENIEDLDSDALMLNTELQFKYFADPKNGNMEMIASLTNIRCHTCRYTPEKREETMAQILQPCTLSFTFSQSEDHGTKVLCNMSDLCLNVAPRSIQIIQNSIQAFIESMNDNTEDSDNSLTETEEDFRDLWYPKDFEVSKMWFLRDHTNDVQVAQDALDTLSSGSTLKSHLSKNEQAIIQINNIVVKFEHGIGNNTIPLLLLESMFSCNVKDWSSKRMTMIGNFNVEMAYYNAKLALWEPVIEPIINENGVKKRWDMKMTLQQNSSSTFGSALVSPNYDENDGAFVMTEHMPPLMMLSLQSTQILEITVTKTLVNILSTFATTFSEITDSNRREIMAPIIVKNQIGKSVTISLESKEFKYFPFGQRRPNNEQGTTIELAKDQEIQLGIYRNQSKDSASESAYISPLQEQTEQAEASLRLKVKGEKGIYEIPVCKADKRFFPFQFRGDERGDNHGMISEISVANGTKCITLKTIIDIKNHYIQAVNVFHFDGIKSYKKICKIEPDQTASVPLEAVYKEPYEFYFQIEGKGETMGYKAVNWRQLMDGEKLSEQIQCTNTQGLPDKFINVEGIREEVFLERSGNLTGTHYILDIRPLVVMKNCLPVNIYYAIGGPQLDQDLPMSYIEPGQSGHLPGIRFGYSSLHLKIYEFRETDWTCSQVIEELTELTTWRFYSVESNEAQKKMDLGINSVICHGTTVLSIYAPFWMINKTGKDLVYRGQDPSNLIFHPSALEEVPMMFSFTKRFMGKRKASVKIGDSSWSDPFTLDTIEDAGKVTCKGKSETFYVGVNINMSKSSLTKIITFTPYYLIYNTTVNSILLWEADALDIENEQVEVGPGQMLPIWPLHGADKVVAKIKGEKDVTAPFSMQEVHSSLLLLRNRFGGIFVDVRASASETLVTLTTYKRGLAPVHLINHTKEQVIRYGEKGSSDSLLLMPGQSAYYTWLNPKGDRVLVWARDSSKQVYENSLQTDERGVIDLPDDNFLSWVSFLDGMQRVLLFTDDTQLCYSLANTTGEHERIAHELDISIFGIGISVVNNTTLANNYEVVYMSISSSDVVWEIRKHGKTRYKSLTKSQCDAIEKDFQLYIREKSIGRHPQSNRIIQPEGGRKLIEVDYETFKMFSPHEGSINRQFQKGLWLQLRTSAHQRQIHAKINRIQIDNQLVNCLFPVILAPVPPPKSVLADSIPKPFMELSMLQYISPERTNMTQYKYICALVQEVHLKIDQGLLNALMELSEADEEILDEDINEFLKEDLALARKPLNEFASLRVTQGQKDFFDYLHLSPLKVHVSFSLTSYQSKMKASRRSNFISLFFQSLGVTITDTDDVIFRLAYFERKHNFYSSEDLLKEMSRHYTSQAIKQAYVIIFGLDVIGNPFGLVVGVTRSVEDLFYEPFQGAVQGPSEFAEGLVIGVRSVFSGVVGGAAGTVSRITGALGKGIASLTFDEKFQNKRREAIKKRGNQNFRESLARNSKGLAMGIFEGVTGVATKPIEGAMEEGVGGFFKGVGKGVVGLVARPTGGIIDFASGTFDSVKRVTETQEEINRKRHPRFLHNDGVVRNYNVKEAVGWKYLRELEKGRYADSDIYVAHEVIPADYQAVILVSNKRILFITYQNVLGSWALDWEYSMQDITGPPSTGRDGERWYIVIEPKEKKKSSFLGVFGSGDNGKKVFICSRENARQLANTIEEIRTSVNQS